MKNLGFEIGVPTAPDRFPYHAGAWGSPPEATESLRGFTLAAQPRHTRVLGGTYGEH